MEINGMPIVEGYVNDDQSITLEPIIYKKDLLIPISRFGKPMYFKIPGELIKEVVDANTPWCTVTTIKR